MSSDLIIREDDVTDPAVHALLAMHLESAAVLSPPESVHALGIEALQAPDVTVWTAWIGEDIAGIGALKRLTPDHGELKSMRTAPGFLRQGIGTRLLAHMIQAAILSGLDRLSLETGTDPAYFPAHGLYQRHGFVECGPFADYGVDPHSLFMTRTLQR